MADESKRYWIVFNGEIYNYLEIREELIEKGYKFFSNSDTEVIIKSYIEWGTYCLNKFNGMWAFAIWDNEKKELFCARDRFGVKPFYYYYKDGYFVFASEIKAILEAESVPREPNYTRILQYLGNYPLLENQSTFFKNIFQLPSSHFALINAKGIAIERYWDIEKKNIEGVDAKEKFLELFKDSIRLRLRSDVPVGTCLSGGLDSSSIVCVLNKMIDPSKQKTFSSCFEDKRFDEREYIEEVIKNTSVTPFYTFPDINELYPKLEKIVWHHDEPFESTSIMAQWCVMELAKNNGVIVILDGQGSDEILAGYHPYKWYLFLDSIRNKNIFEIIKN
jgi:asparagine synthase (glutamine-hydrolysing)